MNQLRHNLSLRVSQRQILTPGLVQMVSVLALNKLELKDMINAEIVENPILEELENQVPILDNVVRKEDEHAAPSEEAMPGEKKDPFEEIDFGSYFKDYLDPGYRSSAEMEEIDRPSFDSFLSKPTNLTDHLMWQLGSLSVTRVVRAAAEEVIGNLNEEGYMLASDDELLGLALSTTGTSAAEAVAAEIAAEGVVEGATAVSTDFAMASFGTVESGIWAGVQLPESVMAAAASAMPATTPAMGTPASSSSSSASSSSEESSNSTPLAPVLAEAPTREFAREDLYEAILLVQQMDPPGVAARDLRECLLAQIRYQQQLRIQHKNGDLANYAQLLSDAEAIVRVHLHALQLKQYKEIGRAISRPIEAVMQALEFIRTLDPRPGLRYNKVQARVIEPDAAFIKQGDEWLVVFNDEDIPQLRLNSSYRKLMQRDQAEKDVRNYVKERFKSAIQLIKNIEQRKHTILRVCHSILERQQEFLEHGIDQLKPMMIKEVAEEIGVHPSTVSRAVANKYVHTPQGVFELRYFFSESVQGPEGGGTSLLILKRRVKKLIEEEDKAKPLTDDQITRILQSQGIQVTRRTVAKYREDMKIPSTHQRRVKKN